MVSENSVSVISIDEVPWEYEIEFFDEDISVTSIVLEMFSMEVVICSFSEDKIEVPVTNKVGTDDGFTRCVED